MKHTEETVPCRICGEPTPMTGTRLCNNCWEIETRLESPRLKPEARAHFLRMLATPELFKAVDEADTAFAVVNICDDLTPQARGCLKKAWPLIQDLRVMLKPNGVYEAAVKEARAEEQKEAEQPAKVRIVIDMEGGTFETIQHDNPNVSLDIAILENKHYLDRKEDTEEEGEVWIDDDTFLYTHMASEVNPTEVDFVFEKIAKVEE